jgi:hypothetical protein
MAKGLGFVDQPQATTPAVPEEMRRRTRTPQRQSRYTPRKTMFMWMQRNIRPTYEAGGFRTLARDRTDTDAGPTAPGYTDYIEI